MYILKNAWRSITRSKGRNILIGIILFVIAVSACIALSIGEAAETARQDSEDQLSITGQISVNRQAMMQNQYSKEDKKEAMTNMEELSLDDLKSYADSDYVKSFYFTSSVSLDASGDLEAVDTSGVSKDSSDSSTETDGSSGDNSGDNTQAPDDMNQGGNQNSGQGMPDDAGRMGTQGDFTITGYSSDEAMTDFLSGASTITEGSVFDESDDTNQCIISSELAEYNDLSVGDTITLVNPNATDETYEFTICGIYESSDAGDSYSNMMGGFGAAFDSANRIYTSYENVSAITEASDTLQSQTNGTYTFDSVDDYEAFKEETEAALGDNYTVGSADVDSYEQSLQPLENLSTYAKYFLAVVLAIGGIILVVLNIFNIRERKYEIGVLAAIGMKKGKIAMQFLIELLCVTFIAIILGTGVGAAASVPVTNKLLAQQIESSQELSASQAENFGREAGGPQGGGPGGEAAPSDNSGAASGTDSNSSDSSTSQSDDNTKVQNGDKKQQNHQNNNKGIPGQAAQYVNQISSATDLAVVGKLILIGIGLTLIAGCVAVVFILRYDPLRILSSRD